MAAKSLSDVPLPPSRVATPHDGLDTLFARATRYETLFAAWRKTEANGGGAGGDGITIERFRQRAEARVSRLAHQLRTGVYKPGPVRSLLVPKPRGGWRPLDIPCIVDRVAQGAVAAVLQPVFEPMFEDSSFAYRPGRSVADAVARVGRLRREGYAWVVDGDITRYFERIPHDRLLSLLDRVIDDTTLVDLIALWLDGHSGKSEGIPQGSPLSPLLSNLYLDAVDEAIEARGVRLVRFADDFVLLCKSEPAAAGALSKMRELLDEHGLELNAEKTRIVPFEQGFRFLGHVFVRSMILRETLEIDAPDGEDRRAMPAPAAEEPAEPPVQAGRWAARSRTLYLVEPGRRLTAMGEAFAVREAERLLLELPQARVDRIEIGPGVACDIDAFDLAAASETEITRVDARGRTLGRWTGAGPQRARRQLAQAGCVLDPARRAALAQIIVMGRVASQRAFLKRFLRGKATPPAAARALVGIGRAQRALRARPHDPKAAMGREGEAAALYWPALGALTEPWAFGGKRRRRAGVDPLNILLDLMSSLLARDIAIAVSRAGLHAGFGVLHESDDEEEALVWDMIEEFRAPVAEAASLSLIARKALVADDFADTDERGLRLSREAWKKAIRGYEAWVGRPIRDPVSGESMMWRSLFDAQAERLAAHFEGAGIYRPYAMDY